MTSPLAFNADSNNHSCIRTDSKSCVRILLGPYACFPLCSVTAAGLATAQLCQLTFVRTHCEDWFCAALCRRETRNFNAADFLETVMPLPNQETSYLYQEKYQHPVHMCKRWDWAPPTEPDKTSPNFETFLWTLIILLPWCVSLPCVLYFRFRSWTVL
jgi:hypothetical protein